MTQLYKKQEDLFIYKKCFIEKKAIFCFYYAIKQSKFLKLFEKSALRKINALF